MITASHNPKEYNGFKLGIGFSETMQTEDIAELRDVIKRQAFDSRAQKGQHIEKDISKEYVDDLFRRVGDIGRFRIVVDSCAGTTGVLLPTILRQAGCEVIEQNTKPDGNFPVGVPDPTERAVQERLARRVVAEGADLGFSYDCDGDRLGVVDQDGNLIWNDTLVSLFAKDVLEFLPGSKIVYNTLCSKQVDEAIRQSGGIPIIWKTGHSFIKAKSREVRAAFGGELSGHFFFLDNFYGHDDGAMASLRLLMYLTRTKKSLKEAVAALPHYFSSPEVKLGCPDAVKFGLVNGGIGGDIRKLYPNASYTEIDGVRMDTKEEMLIIRASHNGPYLTVKFEGKTKEAYDLLKGNASRILHSYAEVDFSEGVNTSALEQ
jgi:phosphomannomutase/phosphoglucomutase